MEMIWGFPLISTWAYATHVPPPSDLMPVHTHKTFHFKRPWIGTMSKKEHSILLSYSSRYFIAMMTRVIKDNPTEPGQLLGDATCRKYQVQMWHGRAPHVVETSEAHKSAGVNEIEPTEESQARLHIPRTTGLLKNLCSHWSQQALKFSTLREVCSCFQGEEGPRNKCPGKRN